MKKITLLGLFALLCATVMKAAAPDWMAGHAVKPGEVTDGMEVVMRCPSTTLSGLVFLQGADGTATVSEDVVWVFESAPDAQNGFYLKWKGAESDEVAYVQVPANQDNSTLLTFGPKTTAGVFTFTALTEADIERFGASTAAVDRTYYDAEYTGRLIVTAQNGTNSAIRNGAPGNNPGGTYAGVSGGEWTLWNLYQTSEDFTAYLHYVAINGPAIEQYILPAAVGAVGGFSADDLTEVKAAAEAGNWAEANTALQALISSNKQIAFDADKYYTLVSAQGVAAGVEVGLFESYTTLGSDDRYTARWKALAGVPSMWKFTQCGTVEVNGENRAQYHVQALNSGLYLPTLSFNAATTLAEEGSAGVYELEDGPNSQNAANIAATFAIKDYNDDRRDFVLLTAQGSGGGVPDWTADNAEGRIASYKDVNQGVNWYLRPATSVSVTVPAGSQYATMNLPFAVELPDGVTAYVGGNVSDSEITLSPLDGTVVPAGCPVILTAEEGSYDLTIAYDNGTSAPANSLSGTLVPQTMDADATAYIVANGSAGVGFYKITDSEDRTIPANKAYYTTNAETADAVLAFSFGPAVGIDGVTTADKGTDTYYDLQGRRVLYPAHGVYVKGNGEKVYIK